MYGAACMGLQICGRTFVFEFALENGNLFV